MPKNYHTLFGHFTLLYFFTKFRISLDVIKPFEIRRSKKPSFVHICPLFIQVSQWQCLHIFIIALFEYHHPCVFELDTYRTLGSNNHSQCFFRFSFPESTKQVTVPFLLSSLLAQFAKIFCALCTQSQRQKQQQAETSKQSCLATGKKQKHVLTYIRSTVNLMLQKHIV